MSTFAVITENFPPCAGGGIAEWAFGVAKHLGNSGHRVVIFSKWKKKIGFDSHRDQPFQIQRMRGRDWHRYRFWYAWYYLWTFLIRNPSAIIFATTWELALPIQFLKKWFPNSKWVVVAHGLEVTRIQNPKTMRKFRKTIDFSNLIIAVSRYTQTAILNLVSENNKNKIVFVPNGVDPNRFQYTDQHHLFKKRLGISPKAKVILTLARVIERKGHDTVIRSLSEILKEFPDTVYVIAGPWKEPYYTMLHHLMDELGVHNHVIFTGYVDSQELNHYYSMSDVYIMVSRDLSASGDSEGFGITFLEAGACHCPVIGSDSGGIPDAIEDGISGFLVSPDNVSLLTEKILTIFRNPELAATLGRQGRERVEAQFTWPKITKTILTELSKEMLDAHD